MMPVIKNLRPVIDKMRNLDSYLMIHANMGGELTFTVFLASPHALLILFCRLRRKLSESRLSFVILSTHLCLVAKAPIFLPKPRRVARLTLRSSAAFSSAIRSTHRMSFAVRLPFLCLTHNCFRYRSASGVGSPCSRR